MVLSTPTRNCGGTQRALRCINAIRTTCLLDLHMLRLLKFGMEEGSRGDVKNKLATNYKDAKDGANDVKVETMNIRFDIYNNNSNKYILVFIYIY